MIELKIDNNDLNESIYIRKSNGIIFTSKLDLLNFYNYFDSSLIEKNENLKIYINNKKLSSKDYILINLMDITSIIESLKFKKGSLLYEYISLLFNNDDIEEISNIESFIEELFLKRKNNFPFKCNYDFNVDVWKLINCTLNIYTNIKTEEINKTILNIINRLMELKFDKTYIVFYDSSMINLDISNYDNAYIFDISTKIPFEDYNILLNNEFKNIDTIALTEKLQLNWPTPIKEKEIKHLLNNYISDYFLKEKIITYDESYIYLIKLLNKYYDLNKILSTNFNNLSNITKSFLDKF